MNRADFLEQVSKRLGRPTPTEAPSRDVIGVPEFWSAKHMAESERMEQFCKCLGDLGAEVYVVPDIHAMQHKLGELLKDLHPSKIGIWNDEVLREWVDPVLTTHHVLTWGIDAPDGFTGTDVGITGCAYAVADTGTLVLSCGGGRGRSVHLLPSVHIALVKRSQLRNRLGEALDELSRRTEAGRMDSYVHFVTGPSRSSDIENDQSIGVHGPAAEMVFVVESL